MARQSTVHAKDAQDQVKEVTDEVAALAEMLKGIATGTGEDLRGAAGEKLDEIARRSQALAEKARLKAKSELSSLEEKISEKPLQSALIAFAIGLLFGILTRR
jgi:ElaB/YqjD/DUF883 family membrane-anchored ribosome-binding protein